MRGSIFAGMALAALASSPAAPAIMPAPQSGKAQRTRPGGSRKERRKAGLRAFHARNTAANRRRGSNKLGRRLRRKFELGKMGAF